MVREPFRIVRGHTVLPRDRRGRREGFTTGTAAAAAAKAGCLILMGREPPESVSIALPIGRTLNIPINTVSWDGERAQSGVIKDAGDDPDVTHGAEILATVERSNSGGFTLEGGEGVGVVTRKGLELPVDSAAINPVPRKMIEQAAQEALGAENYPVKVTISVPNGEELARRTFNNRIGIVGGISILGTTGIVRALSTASWRASVIQQIDVAAANDVQHIVLSTGGRTERFAQGLYPDLPEMAFVEMGIFTGAALERAAAKGVTRVSVCAMIGKLSKIAQGKMQTHVAGNQVDFGFLGELLHELGSSHSLIHEVRKANTARHVQEIVENAGAQAFFAHLSERAARECGKAAGGELDIEVLLFDFGGRILGRVGA